MRPVIQRVILILLLVMAAILIIGAGINYFTSSEKSEPNQNDTSTSQSTQGSTQGPTSPEPAKTNISQPTTTSPTGNGANTTNGTNSTPTTKPSSDLAESGPGSTAAIFAGASLFGYLVYRRLVVRRLTT